MTNVIHYLSHAVVVINGKNDYITPGKKGHFKFPVALSVELSARVNDIIMLRLHTIKFPIMKICFECIVSILVFLKFFPSFVCLICFSAYRTLLNLPFFFQCTYFNSFGRRCAQNSATWPTIWHVIMIFLSHLGICKNCTLNHATNTSFLSRLPCIYSVITSKFYVVTNQLTI
jgi:hypothetical protein